MSRGRGADLIAKCDQTDRQIDRVILLVPYNQKDTWAFNQYMLFQYIMDIRVFRYAMYIIKWESEPFLFSQISCKYT